MRGDTAEEGIRSRVGAGEEHTQPAQVRCEERIESGVCECQAEDSIRCPA